MDGSRKGKEIATEEDAQAKASPIWDVFTCSESPHIAHPIRGAAVRRSEAAGVGATGGSADIGGSQVAGLGSSPVGSTGEGSVGVAGASSSAGATGGLVTSGAAVRDSEAAGVGATGGSADIGGSQVAGLGSSPVDSTGEGSVGVAGASSSTGATGGGFVKDFRVASFKAADIDGSIEGASDSTTGLSPIVRFWELNSISFKLSSALATKDAVISMAMDEFKGSLFLSCHHGVIYEWHKGKKFANFLPSPAAVNNILVRNDSDHSRVFLAQNNEMHVLKRRFLDNEFNEGYSLGHYLGKTLLDLLSVDKPEDNRISSICLSDDEKYIYCATMSGYISAWFIGDGNYKLVDTCKKRNAVNALTVGPKVMFAGSFGFIDMWRRDQVNGEEDNVTHDLLGVFTIENGIDSLEINDLCFWKVNPTLGSLYAGVSNGTVWCWRDMSTENQETNKGLRVEVLSRGMGNSSQLGAISCLSLCSGQFVFSGSKDGTICVWKRKEDGKHKLVMELDQAHSEAINCIAIQGDWRIVATGPPRWLLYSCSNNELKIWEVLQK